MGNISFKKQICTSLEDYKNKLLTNRSIDSITGCWNWTRSLTLGYAQTSYQHRLVRVNRLSLHLFKNFDLDSKLLVCHKCDNPRCFNPDHLFLGTHSDNARDRNIKRRQAKGENQGSHKLTTEQVIEIKKLQKEGFNTNQIKEKLKLEVNGLAVYEILKNKTWKHVKI